MRTLKFPEGFWWGAASSGPQTEGWTDKLHDNTMDIWFRENPEDFFDGVGPDVASDFYNQYKEDFKKFEEIGLNSFRTSIQWSRLIKDFETGEPDEKAVQYYKDLIKTAKEHHIELVMNLSHFDLPADLLKKYGGWESRHVTTLFEKYARTAFKLFGDEVKWWTTFNEPMVVPEAGYLYGFHYPNYKQKGKEAVQVMYNINLASAKAIHAFKEMQVPGEIGIILNLTPSYPRSESEADKKAAEFADAFFNRSFLDTAVKGEFPKDLWDVFEKDHVVPEHDEADKEFFKENTVDFLGVNYYHPKRVKAQDNPEQFDHWVPDLYFEEWEWPEARINPYRGWEIYPQAIYDIAKNVQDNYGNIHWFISENGMGVEGEEKYRKPDGSIDDSYRIDFYKEHLDWLHKAIEEGSNCFGYHPWCAIDCWSWNNAYKNRYGFIGIDLPTQKRTIKESGKWFKTVSDNNAITIE